MSQTLSPAVLFLAAGCAIAPATMAQVTLPSLNRWTMPDFDQRREGLANDGNSHCVPTAHCNMLAYIGAHGWPLAFPDVGNAWSSSEYDDITDNIHDLGVLMSTSGSGGTTGSNKQAGFNQWLVNTGTYLLVNVNYQSGPDVTPWDMYFAMHGGGLVAFSYGRWSYSSSAGEYQRHGGHCVTLRGIADLQFPFQTSGNPMLKYRDPASDEGNVAGRLTHQSPFTTSELRIQRFTQEFEGYGDATFWRLITPNVNDEYRRLIDGFTSITPIFYMENNTVNSLIQIKTPVLAIDSEDEGSLTLTGLVDCAFGKTAGHVFGLANNSLTGGSRLVLANPFQHQITHTVQIPGQNGRIAPGRNGDVYVVSNSLLMRYKPNPDDSGMTPLGTSDPLTIGVSNICYDDNRDGPTMLMGDGSVREYDKALAGFTRKTFAVPPTWPPSAGATHRRIIPCVTPGDDLPQYWLGPLANGQFTRYGSAPGVDIRLVALETVTAPAGLAISDFSLTDRNTLLLKRGGALQELKKNSAGQWVIDTDSPFNGLAAGGGGQMRISRSRTNYDPQIHSLPGWNTDIINPELLGPEVPDCTADLGRTGGVHEPDGSLDNNDFVVFIDYFFALDARADIGSTGGVAASDGLFNNNDFVVFIDRFFQGC